MMQPETPRCHTRIQWVDLVRAWCLVLMVAMHDPVLSKAWGGRVHALVRMRARCGYDLPRGALRDRGADVPGSAQVYLFHVPAQVFLSGVCFQRRATSVGAELLRCCRRLLLPYIAHVCVFTAARVVGRHMAGLDERTPRFVARALFFGGRLLSGNMLSLWILPVVAFTHMLWVVAMDAVSRGAAAWRDVTAVTDSKGGSQAHRGASKRAADRSVVLVACGFAAVSYCCAVVATTPGRTSGDAAVLPPPVWFAADAVLSTFPWFAAGQVLRSVLLAAPEGVAPLPGGVLALAASAAVACGVLSGRWDGLLPHMALDLRQSMLGLPLATPAVTACLIWAHVACARVAVAWLQAMPAEGANGRGARVGDADSELAGVIEPPTSKHRELQTAILRRGGRACAAAATGVSRHALAAACWHIAVMRSPVFDMVGAPPMVRVVAGICVPLAVHRAFSMWWVTRCVMLGRQSARVAHVGVQRHAGAAA